MLSSYIISLNEQKQIIPLAKIFVTLILLCFTVQQVKAQDVIVKKDGATILSKVIEVNETILKYKKFKNLQGSPRISKDLHIVYLSF